MRPLVALACSLLLFALPAIAHACPSCAGREDGGTARIIVLGIMILLPFAIALVVYRVIRGANARARRFDATRVP
jgi:hypothetical protein